MQRVVAPAQRVVAPAQRFVASLHKAVADAHLACAGAHKVVAGRQQFVAPSPKPGFFGFLWCRFAIFFRSQTRFSWEQRCKWLK